MAGSHHSGFKYSRSNLFQGAPMVLVPPRYDDPMLLSRVKAALEPCRFGSFSVTTAQAHDKLIAFTSQMPHIVSNAYIKSPTAKQHKGFSAGSYKDLTRVAWLNPQMWAELFLANKENVLFELDSYATPVIMMEAVPGETLDPAVEEKYRKAMGYTGEIERMERYAFYERAKQAYAVVVSGETAKYGNIILKKGVTPIA